MVDIEKLRLALEHYWRDFLIWVDTRLISWETLIQLAVVLILALVALAVAPLFKKLAAPAVPQTWLGDMWRRIHMVIAARGFILFWAILVLLADAAAAYAELPRRLLATAASLLVAWVVIRIAADVIRNRFWARVVAVIAWTVAALNIFELLDPVLAGLRSAAFKIGKINLSALSIIQGALLLALLLWLAFFVTRLVERALHRYGDVQPAASVLIVKILRLVLIAAVFLIVIDSIGIDLTALAVFGGALGVGIGFGLQKIVANFISGIILLLDRSIKPGDVIAVEGTYGWIKSLRARYASVLTRDGTEILIPNELLITEKVTNWSYTDNLVRIRLPVGISYNSDVELAIKLCEEAAADTQRVHDQPPPRCLIKGFGDSSVDLDLRIWIDDPQEGRANVSSAVYLNIWKKFHENGIEIPFPQRDIHLKPPAVVEVRRAARAEKDPAGGQESAPGDGK